MQDIGAVDVLEPSQNLIGEVAYVVVAEVLCLQ